MATEIHRIRFAPFTSSASIDLSSCCRELLQHGQQLRQLVLHFTAVNDHVDSAFLQQELGTLETLR